MLNTIFIRKNRKLVFRNRHKSFSNIESISVHKSVDTIESLSLIKNFISHNIFLKAALNLSFKPSNSVTGLVPRPG